MTSDNGPNISSEALEQVHIFHSIGKALTGTLNLSEVLSIIMEKISDLFNPSHWSLLLYDEERQALRFEIVVGKGSAELQGSWLDVSEGIAGWVARHCEPIICEDVHKDERFAQQFDQETGFETRSIVAVPLISKGKLLGVIELINLLEQREFTDVDLEILNTLTDYAAIAIENARSVQRIRELTVTDDVTGLYNARYLQQALEQEVSRSHRADKPLSVIFIDLDYFKNINDTHGHLIGSDVLRETSEILRERLRATDIATRYGGDEFVVLLPDTPQELAVQVAERVREAMKSHLFGRRHQIESKVTASFGIATYPDDTDDKIDLIRLADQAMYYVKENSRDDIACASVLRAQT